MGNQMRIRLSLPIEADFLPHNRNMLRRFGSMAFLIIVFTLFHVGCRPSVPSEAQPFREHRKWSEDGLPLSALLRKDPPSFRAVLVEKSVKNIAVQNSSRPTDLQETNWWITLRFQRTNGTWFVTGTFNASPAELKLASRLIVNSNYLVPAHLKTLYEPEPNDAAR
jgi:hypothetical protein